MLSVQQQAGAVDCASASNRDEPVSIVYRFDLEIAKTGNQITLSQQQASHEASVNSHLQ